ncbi:MAG: uracil-DNA glycosylase [Candidatus Berkelbacteria bacterium]|nr:uracil-DNA glycosylase [Candidatus Berkelbacteria bacterium]
MDLEKTKEQLINVEKEIASCQLCPLYKTRRNIVPGEGNPHAEIMFIGEAPGAREDECGRPFCGPAGKFLDVLLDSIGLQRADVYIANTLKCRPPANRDPLPEEKSACRKYLEEQIAIINPKIVVTLGRHSTETYLPDLGGITKLRAKLYHRPLGHLTEEANGIFYFPLYHPAAALHNGAMRQTLLDDFAKLPAAIKKVKAEIEKNKRNSIKQEKLF